MGVAVNVLRTPGRQRSAPAAAPRRAAQDAYRACCRRGGTTRHVFWLAAWLWGAIPVLAGCTNNPFPLGAKATAPDPQQTALAQRSQELQSRATTLDRDNQELETLLAQSRQQTRLLEDQVAALREQLSGATAQLARLKAEHDDAASRAETLSASIRRRAGATITSNRSLEERLPAVNIPGVEVRADGDVIRIELPGAKLFSSGNARLLPQAGPLIDQVAAEVLRTYPAQMIGIEGHTDTDPVRSMGWTSNHQLSLARAMSVYDHLTTQSRLPANQLFVVGHGANHPIVSNGTSAGKERNRRVELVIYPERMPGR